MDTQVMLAGVALLGTLAALGSPLLMASLTNRNAIKLKEQDWKRQDEVAAKAEAASTRNSLLLAELNQKQNATAAVTIGKLDVLHTLSNSTLTAAMQIAMDGLKRELILMERDPATDAAMVAATKKKMEEMQAILDERNKQTVVANLQEQQAEAIKAAKAVGVITTPYIAPVQISLVQVPPTPDNPHSLGTETDKVLRGEGNEIVKAATSSVTEQQIAAAAETVAAADKTVKAASKTMEAIKETKP